MAIVKPFKGLRNPNQVVCEELACLPYDVMNSGRGCSDGCREAEVSLTRDTCRNRLPSGNGYSFGNRLPQECGEFQDVPGKGWLVQDNEAKFYIYAQTMDGRTQYGIVGCAACEDYMNGIIKKHELTVLTRKRIAWCLPLCKCESGTGIFCLPCCT